MSDQGNFQSTEIKIAHTVRDACVEAAQEGFRDASMSGLCAEGAAEAAVSSIQRLNIEKLIAEAKQQSK